MTMRISIYRRVLVIDYSVDIVVSLNHNDMNDPPMQNGGAGLSTE
jgi:hypothetical protein